MAQEDTNRRIRDFLAPQLGVRELHDEDDMFALGFVNSLFAMQLVLFVEKEFGVAVEPEDLEFDNFRSVAALTRFVEAKSSVADKPPVAEGAGPR